MERQGFVLVFTVLVLVGLATLGAGMLSVAVQEQQVARARVDALRARLAAESGARAAISGWRSSSYRDLAAGMRRAIAVPALADAGFDVAVVVERLAGPLYLIRSRAVPGNADGPKAHAGAGYLIRALDPLDAWREFPAALSVGGAVHVSAGARLDGLASATPPAPWPETACPATYAGTLVELFGGTERPALRVPSASATTVEAGADATGAPAVAIDPALTDPAAFDHLGLLEYSDVAAAADRSVSGSLSLRPAYRNGACDLGRPGNWGSPLSPTGPCGDVFPLIHSAGDLEIWGGSGQGVLVVDGDLTIRGETRFYGAILVRGRIRLADGAEIHGAVRSGGTAEESRIGDGAIYYSACALGRALDRSPGLDRAFRPAGRSWVRLF